MEQEVQAEVVADQTATPEVPSTAEGTEVAQQEQEQQQQAKTYTEAELKEQLDAQAAKIRNKSERKTEREIQALREQLQALQQSNPPQKQAEQDVKPKLEDFNSIEEYQDARDEYRERQLRQKLAEESDAKSQQSAQQDKIKQYQVRSNEFAKANPDYVETLENAGEVRPHVANAILDSEIGPQIAYHLGKNPQELDRLNGLNPSAVWREIGRLEVKLTPPEPPAAPKTSNAPPPAKPLQAGKSAVDVDESKLSDEDWAKRRQQERAKA